MQRKGDLTVEWNLTTRKRVRRKPAEVVTEVAAPNPTGNGRVPRATRLMALAIKFQHMIDQGDVRDYADLARLGYVTRARMTQIMKLTTLAPDIQEQLLFLPNTLGRRDAITERLLRRVVAHPSWPQQRALWREISSRP